MKRISIILLLAMTAAMFAACSGDSTSGASETTGAAETVETTTAAETLYVDNIPQLDFEGRTITVYADGYTTADFAEFFNVYEETGSGVSDAAYQRNRSVEERLNVDIVYTEDVNKSDFSRFSSSVLAGAQAYDILHSHFNNQAILEGMVLDLADNIYIDCDQPYYMHYVNEEMEMLNRQFTVTGYYDMETLGRTAAVFFSSNLAEDYGIEDLYGLVDSNGWTFDKMLELASSSYADIDGDGEMTTEDVYGLCGGFNMNGMLITSTGYRYTTKLDDGTRKLTGINDVLLGFNEMLFDTYASEWYFNCYPKGGTNGFVEAVSTFTNDKYLFFLYDISSAKTFAADMEDYGILPIPKYLETQDDYTSYCRPFMTSIPIDAADPNAAGAVIEALNMYSYSILLPAYYDVALSVRYASTPEASETLDIIFSNVCCDFAQMWYGPIGLRPGLHNTVGVEENYVSYFESVEDQVNIKLVEIFEAAADANG